MGGKRAKAGSKPNVNSKAELRSSGSALLFDDTSDSGARYAGEAVTRPAEKTRKPSLNECRTYPLVLTNNLNSLFKKLIKLPFINFCFWWLKHLSHSI